MLKHALLDSLGIAENTIGPQPEHQLYFTHCSSYIQTDRRLEQGCDKINIMQEGAMMPFLKGAPNGPVKKQQYLILTQCSWLVLYDMYKIKG